MDDQLIRAEDAVIFWNSANGRVLVKHVEELLNNRFDLEQFPKSCGAFITSSWRGSMRSRLGNAMIEIVEMLDDSIHIEDIQREFEKIDEFVPFDEWLKNNAGNLKNAFRVIHQSDGNDFDAWARGHMLRLN